MKTSCLILLACLAASPVFAADPALAPTTRSTRRPDEIQRDWVEASEALRAVLPSPQAVADPQARLQVAPIATPLLKRALDITDEMYQSDASTRARSRQLHYHLLSILAFLDDRDALLELSDARQSNHREVAALGRHYWYLAQWWRNAEDPKASAALLDELERLAIESPTDDDLATLLAQIRQEGTANDAQLHRVESIIIKRLRGPFAQIVIAELQAAEKRRSLQGKPLLISAPTLAGKPFSTQSLQGHPVIVHFGVTACGPWEQEHNQLLQQFEKLQASGVRIVTILCDPNRDTIDLYIQRHREVPWPMLRDPASPANFAAQYGIEQFPVTLILSADGTVQQTDANLNDPKTMETLLNPPATTQSISNRVLHP